MASSTSTRERVSSGQALKYSRRFTGAPHGLAREQRHRGFEPPSCTSARAHERHEPERHLGSEADRAWCRSIGAEEAVRAAADEQHGDSQLGRHQEGEGDPAREGPGVSLGRDLKPTQTPAAGCPARRQHERGLQEHGHRLAEAWRHEKDADRAKAEAEQEDDQEICRTCHRGFRHESTARRTRADVGAKPGGVIVS